MKKLTCVLLVGIQMLIIFLPGVSSARMEFFYEETKHAEVLEEKWGRLFDLYADEISPEDRFCANWFLRGAYLRWVIDAGQDCDFARLEEAMDNCSSKEEFVEIIHSDFLYITASPVGEPQPKDYAEQGERIIEAAGFGDLPYRHYVARIHAQPKNGDYAIYAGKYDGPEDELAGLEIEIDENGRVDALDFRGSPQTELTQAEREQLAMIQTASDIPEDQLQEMVKAAHAFASEYVNTFSDTIDLVLVHDEFVWKWDKDVLLSVYLRYVLQDKEAYDFFCSLDIGLYSHKICYVYGGVFYDYNEDDGWIAFDP